MADTSDTEKTRTNKARMLESLQAKAGVVKPACQEANISRDTHYRWLKEDPDYKQQVAQIQEDQVDFVESRLLQKISEGDTTSIIFYLKTKGKDRGYVERSIQQMELSEDFHVEFQKKDE